MQNRYLLCTGLDFGKATDRNTIEHARSSPVLLGQRSQGQSSAVSEQFRPRDSQQPHLTSFESVSPAVHLEEILIACRCRNCLMAKDASNDTEAEQLFTRALEIDPANETVLTMFAIFKCNR